MYVSPFLFTCSPFRPLHCICSWLAVSNAHPKVIVCKVTCCVFDLPEPRVSQLWKCTLHDTNRLPLILSSARHVWHVSLFCLSSRLVNYLLMQPLSFFRFCCRGGLHFRNLHAGARVPLWKQVLRLLVKVAPLIWHVVKLFEVFAVCFPFETFVVALFMLCHTLAIKEISCHQSLVIFTYCYVLAGVCNIHAYEILK